jgi:phosphodiesterase/alkaline phosphatase D-like protein
VAAIVDALPHAAYANTTQNGYGVLDLTAETCRCEFRVVSTTATPDADIATAATFEVGAGDPGVRVV